MILEIGDVLDPARCAAIVESLGAEALWRDGAETASGRASRVKNNLQADRAALETKAASEMITRAVLSHPIIASAAIPDRMVRLLISRSASGMGYGDHVDAAYIDGFRTDLSFTLFLSDPSTYDGGELTLLGAGSVDSIKLSAGALALYPSTMVHRVETVRRGVRLAAVGWIRSRVPRQEARSAIFEFDQICSFLEANGAPADALDRLQNVKNNLLRLHGE